MTTIAYDELPKLGYPLAHLYLVLVPHLRTLQTLWFRVYNKDLRPADTEPIMQRMCQQMTDRLARKFPHPPGISRIEILPEDREKHAVHIYLLTDTFRRRRRINVHLSLYPFSSRAKVERKKALAELD